jgi:hypothetical protein
MPSSAGCLRARGGDYSSSPIWARASSPSPRRRDELKWRGLTAMSARHGVAEVQRAQIVASRTRTRRASALQQRMVAAKKTVRGKRPCLHGCTVSAQPGSRSSPCTCYVRLGLSSRAWEAWGDEGIDGIGLVPISAVLSSRVAVQAKRYDPTTTIGRDVVALFQRDAATAGAERAVLVTLARFSPAARKAATVTTPTVDLIDGDKLCELMRDQETGLRIVPQVNEGRFDRFDA